MFTAVETEKYLPGDIGYDNLSVSAIVGALSYALDLTEGAKPGHTLRSCLLGMRIGEEMGLSPKQLSSLYYALLLKDAGCSSNASRLHQIVGGDEIRAKSFSKTNDWQRFEWRQFQFLFTFVHQRESLAGRARAIGALLKNSSTNAELLFRLRCNQGAAVVKQLGLDEDTAEAIYNLDEHWNGRGYPDRRAGEQIPLLARIVNLAQTLEVFHSDFGPNAAVDCIQRRRGRWFDPAVVRAAVSLIRRGAMWGDINSYRLRQFVTALEPESHRLTADDHTIDNVCSAFASIVDAKSPSTFLHSSEVARIAVSVGTQLGMDAGELKTLHRAALLHDVGKLAVPNSILDKPSRLTPDEWKLVQAHPRHTFDVLSRVPTFSDIADVAASHHEKLDGSGYHLGLHANQINLMSRTLTIADMFEALSADRPYHEKLSTERVLGILAQQTPHALDPECLAALQRSLSTPLAA